MKFIVVFGQLTKAAVAPVRERGLKLRHTAAQIPPARRRSREGAWIEIDAHRVMAQFG